jgi:TIR domain
MSAKIFVSYRRDDSAGHAGRVTDRLEREFGRDLLFMDVDGIPLGMNFVKVLNEEVAKCGALLAVIGPNWLDVRDDDGNRRLDNPNDFVRIEIAAALQRDIPVIPILLDGAKMPRGSQLPDDLRELASRNGLDVRHASFHNDMEKLIHGLKGPTIATTSKPEAGHQAAHKGNPQSPPSPSIHTVTNEDIARFDPKVSELLRMNTEAAPRTLSASEGLLNRPGLLLGAMGVAAAIAVAFLWFYFSPGADVKSDVKSKAPELQFDRPSDKAPAPLNTPAPPRTKVQ